MKSVKRAVILTAVILTVGLAFLFWGPSGASFNNMEKVSFKTSDNKNISANYFPASNPKGWLLLVHMMPAVKESWNELAQEMQNFGYASVAIDLRGHGESEGGPDSFSRFSDAEHQAGIRDLDAAWEFLKIKGASPENTVVVGASIGANLSLLFLTQHLNISGGVLLSPGNYKGLDGLALVKKIASKQKIVFAASKQDDRSGGNNATDNQMYYDSASQTSNRYLIIFDGAGHGTDLFKLKNELNLINAIKKFLEHGSIN